MKSKKYLLIFLLSCSGFMLGMSLSFAESAQPAVQPDPNEKAMAIVNRMAEYLAGAKSFSVTADIGFDAVQESGQKIEFGETRNIVLKRPDRFRVDETKRNGDKSQLIFDGKNMTLYHAKENVYAIDPKAGTVDEIVRYFVDDLGMRLPLAEMLSTQLPKVLQERVSDAIVVEESSIAGVLCDHVALRGKEIDVQLWIAQGDKPLPQRVVIAYTKADGGPEFRAQFSNWTLEPGVPDTFFVFEMPKDATKIAFSIKQVTQPVKEAAKEEKK